MVGTVMKMSDTLRIVRTVSNAFDELNMVGTVRKLFLMRLGEGWSQHWARQGSGMQHGTRVDGVWDSCVKGHRHK
jgi:hypothetical protein